MIHLKVLTGIIAGAISLSASTASAAPPPRAVSFFCGSGIEIRCLVPRMANPEFSTHCWYISGGRRYLMQREGPFRFVAGPIRVRLVDGLPMSARVRNFETGFRAFCSEE